MVAGSRSGAGGGPRNNKGNSRLHVATASGSTSVASGTTATTTATSKYSSSRQQENKKSSASTSSGKGKQHYSEYPKIEQAIQTMKASLGRFTRANDRRMVLRTLKEVKYLKALPLESRPPPMVDLEELEMEVAKENLVLNGQAFHRKTKYGRTSTDFLHVLHELCYQLCENASSNASQPGIMMSGNLSIHTGVTTSNQSSMISTLAMTLSPDTLYYDLLCRLARTITSADCYARMNDILGSNELILMNSSAERKPKVKKNKALANNPTMNNVVGEMGTIPPIEVNIFEEGGNIHAHIVTTLGYGLYRKLDVNTGRPWIKMQAELSERMNFSSGAQVRHVTCVWPDMYV